MKERTMAENEAAKNIVLAEMDAIQKKLESDDVTITDIAKAMSLIIKVNVPAIRKEPVYEDSLETRLRAFRNDCPVHSQWVKEQETLNSMPILQLFKLARKQVGWIFGGIVILIVWLQRTGWIHFGK